MMVWHSRLMIAVATSVLFGGTSVAFGAPSKGGPARAGAPRATGPHAAPPKAVHPTKPISHVTPAGHAKAPKTAGAPNGKSAAHSPKKTTSTAATTAPTLDPKIAQKLERDNGLTRRLQSRLGPGVDLQRAAAGFKNQGQFVAAVNNSSNADQFWRLRALMTGFNRDGTPTRQPTMSLGQAKQVLGIHDSPEGPIPIVPTTKR